MKTLRRQVEPRWTLQERMVQAMVRNIDKPGVYLRARAAEITGGVLLFASGVAVGALLAAFATGVL